MKMTRSQVLADLREKCKDDVIHIFDKSQKRVYVDVKPESIRKCASYIFNDLGARFNIASGVDVRYHIEILYHFIIEDLNLLISLRVKLQKPDLEIDSLAPMCEATNWIERELCEMLGITFKGHPDMRRLLLSDDWPEGVHPLRRDYEEWDKNAIRDRGV